MDLIAEIWLCLALAALLGGIIGWLLRGARCSRELEDLKARWQNRLGLLRTDLDDARHKLAESQAMQAEQEAAHDSLRLEIEQREARAVNLQSTLETYASDIEKKNSQGLELASALDACQLENEKVEAQLQGLVEDLEALRTELETARGETNPARTEAAGHREELARELDERDARIAELERELAAADRLGAEPDALQRIHGVGPVLEKMLHRIGVYTFRQIAAWDAADIAWAAAKLDAFPDRIERDQWVAQAARLHRERQDAAPHDQG